MSKCTVLWSLKNIRKDWNDTITLDSTKTTLPEGYYTFSELQTLLKTHGVTITKLQNNHITLRSTKNVYLHLLAEMLGFSKTNLNKDTTYTSDYELKMTNGLKEIQIYSPSLVDGYRNYSLYLGQYVPSSLLFSANIDTTQKLDGTITNFSLDNSRIPLGDFSGQDIEFEVESRGHSEDYEIRLTITIE